ncbi:MAG: hypothetical protein K5928_01720, partial [Prevotella sp.]|nr:hypothetical protein [Prevotella sp.]
GEHTYAVIISGGVNKYSNYIRYWNDCSFLYRVLTRRFLVPKTNISLLMADGDDPATDQFCNNYFRSSATDLDGDGVADLHLAATKANVLSELNRLSQVMTDEDKLLIFVTDHGGTTDYSGGSYICLWNNGKLYDYELASSLSSFDVRSICVVLGQCFSGGFLDNLNSLKRVSLAASTGSEVSWAMSNLCFDEFLYHWTCAVNESDYLGNSVASDSDGDGKVTMLEAFNYAKAHDTRSEHPQKVTGWYQDKSWAINDHSFSHELMIRDNEEDAGYEPNYSTDISWRSPAFWIRNDNDTICELEELHVSQNDPILYINVRVTNNGRTTYTGDGSMFLHGYWALSSSSQTLPAWYGEEIESTSNLVAGGIMTQKPIRVAIQPGETKTVSYQWVLGEELVARLNSPGDHAHVCVLMAVSADGSQTMQLPYGITVGENGDTLKWVSVLEHNWIAQKNVFLQNGAQQSGGMTLLVRGNGPQRLELWPAEGRESDLAMLDVAVGLDDGLYASWQASDKSADNASILRSSPQTVHLNGRGSTVSGLVCGKSKSGSVTCSAEFIASEDVVEERTIEYDIVQRDEASGQVVGGERFVFVQKPRKAISPVIEYDENCLTAAGVDEPASYEWYDAEGNKVATGRSVAVPQKTGSYTVKVKADSDGAVGYASIAIDSGLHIAGISPVPFGQSISVTLSAPAYSNTTIRLTPVGTAGKAHEIRVNEGELRIDIATTEYVKGTYLVTLLHDGQALDSRQIVHE